MSVRLNWDNDASPDAVAIYRSLATMDPMALPDPHAVIPASSLTFLDTTALTSTVYFYRVSNVNYGSPAAEEVSDEVSVDTTSFQPAAISDVQVVALDGATQGDLTFDVSGFDEVLLTIVNGDFEDTVNGFGVSGATNIEVSTDGGLTWKDQFGPSSDFALSWSSDSRGQSGRAQTGLQFNAHNAFDNAVEIDMFGFARLTGLGAGSRMMWESVSRVPYEAGRQAVFSEFTEAITHIRWEDASMMQAGTPGEFVIERIKHRSVVPIEDMDFAALNSPTIRTIAGMDRLDLCAVDVDLEYRLSLGAADQFLSNNYGRLQWYNGTGGPGYFSEDPQAAPRDSREVQYSSFAPNIGNALGCFSIYGLSDAGYCFPMGFAGSHLGGRDLVSDPALIQFDQYADGSNYTSGFMYGQLVAYEGQAFESVTMSGQTDIDIDVTGYREAQITFGGPLALSAADRVILQVSTDNGVTFEDADYLSVLFNGDSDAGVPYAEPGLSPDGEGIALTDASVTNSYGCCRVVGLVNGATCVVDGIGASTDVNDETFGVLGMFLGNRSAVTHLRLTTAGGATFDGGGQIEVRKVDYFTG